MKKIAYIPATLLLTLLFATCSGEEKIPQPGNQPVEIMFSMDNYTKVVTSTKSGTFATTRATEMPGSEAENTIADLNLFLFGASDVKHYYFSSTSTPGGSEWTPTATDGTGTIKLSLSQAEAGTRDVYIVANYGADLSGASEAISSVDDLEDKLLTNDNPWSPNLRTPILMSGFKGEHDFIEKRILGDGIDEPVHLIRALAKVELNVTLTSGFQVIPTDDNGGLAEYRFRYVDFDTRTYVVKPETKPNKLASSSAEAWPTTVNWTPWGASLNGSTPPATGAGYTLDDDKKVTGLKLITYLNERDEPGAVVEIELPRVDDGPLPPPEFGPELYTLPLPGKVERNNWYVYDIEI